MWIEQAAACAGSATYLEDARGTGRLTYAGLHEAVLDWERRLDDAGLPPGTRIAVRLSEPLEYATALLAIIGAGRVAVPLDPGAPDTDVARVLAVARPAVTVADGTFGINSFDRAAPEVAGGGIFLCTSGTTGTPKGILLRDEQLAHVAASVVSHHRLTSADRGYCSLPLFHVNAEVVGLLATLCAGATLAVDRKFSASGEMSAGSPGSTRFRRSSRSSRWTRRRCGPPASASCGRLPRRCPGPLSSGLRACSESRSSRPTG